MSPRKVPTSTSITMPSPCGSWRSITAWASARPIQKIPSSVIASPATEGRGWRRVSRNSSGSAATVASSTFAVGLPYSAAASSPASATKPARRTGWVRSYMRVELVHADPAEHQHAEREHGAALDHDEQRERDRRQRGEDPCGEVGAPGAHRPPKRRRRALNSASDCSSAVRVKSGHSSSRKTSSE